MEKKEEILKKFENQINRIKLLIMIVISGTINIAIIPFIAITTIIELLAINDYTEYEIYTYEKIKDEQLKLLNEKIEIKKEEKQLILNNYYNEQKTKEKVKIKK